jgi:transcriptional regulator with XRE-family HTH domain
MQRHRDRRGLSQRALGELLSLERSNLSQFETGTRVPPPDVMQRWYAVFGLDPEVERLHLAALGERGLDRRARRGRSQTRWVEPRSAPRPDAELDRSARTLAETEEERAARIMSAEHGIAEALDLLRQVEESDLDSETLEQIDHAVDRPCCLYSSGPLDEVRTEARRLLRHVALLLRGRLTLQQRRQLLVAAGWLALLTSALHFDVGDRTAAEATRELAFQLGRQAGHHEIMAWTFETEAWFAVCNGRYREAVDLARAGQGFAGRATSASVQLAVQEARAWARCGEKAEVRDAMRRASTALRRLPRPAHPEHHFVFDPAKLVFYMATCYVRVGDADRAEDYAREVIAQSAGPSGVARWPRRLVTARMDLGLALTQLNRPDEACFVGSLALASNSLVASNLWQASELDAKLVGGYASLPEAQQFHEQYLSARRSIAGST